MWAAERRFADALDAIGWRYIHQPTRFRLAERTYRPDFYVHDNDTYYEVVGSKQAYFKGRDKYERFVSEYPGVRFIIIDCGANVHYDYGLDRLESWPVNPWDHED